MGSYGSYQYVRNTAWECLLKHGITSLPVDILRIAKGEKCIRVIKNSSVNMLEPSEDARSYYANGIWYIVYDDRCDVATARYAIAHELGHYFLAHDSKHNEYVGRPTAKNAVPEHEADEFACRLLCPSCILCGIGAVTPQDISALCLVNEEVACARAKRLDALIKRNSFLVSSLERDMYVSFLPFIEANKRPDAVRLTSIEQISRKS